MAALDSNSLLFEEKPLFVPKLEEVKEVLTSCLLKNFETVVVEVVDCPDLSVAPYNLAKSGLGGSPALLEAGGPPYLLPLVDKSKIYDIKTLAEKVIGSGSEILAVGAGAGPFSLRGTNCEGIYNMRISSDGKVTNKSYSAKVCKTASAETCVLEPIPDSETKMGLLLNLFLCKGTAGKVIRVSCKKRIGTYNFIECMRLGLADYYKGICVGMGGLFLLKKGAAHQHVMRDFSKTPINSEEELNQWLKFFEMPAQLNAVGTLITHENDLDLRLQHFHSFSSSNWGGHYHYDTTPDVAEYEGFFNMAEKVVRVDKPLITHKFGRD